MKEEKGSLPEHRVCVKRETILLFALIRKKQSQKQNTVKINKINQ